MSIKDLKIGDVCDCKLGDKEYVIDKVTRTIAAHSIDKVVEVVTLDKLIEREQQLINDIEHRQKILAEVRSRKTLLTDELTKKVEV